MDSNEPYDEWSKHIHAVITFLKPFFNDWRSYVSLISMLLGIGVLVMENQVLLRMRMGRWEIGGYIVWCLISSVLGPVFDIIVMIGLFVYCRRKSSRMHITNESIAKALLPAPVTRNYRFMGGVCIVATLLTLTSNILYMLRGWKGEPSQSFSWFSDGVRWMTSQIWYAIGMIFLFHVVTRPAQSGVVIFGKFPRDLWSYKWYLCILYVPVHYMLLELCDVHRDTRHILIPLEIVVDITLYNGPFLVVLLRLLYLAWKVAYDEAVLTGAIFEDDSTPGSMEGAFSGGSSRRGGSSSRPGAGGYVGLAMVDMDEAERGHGRGSSGDDEVESHVKSGGTAAADVRGQGQQDRGQQQHQDDDDDVYVLEDEDDDEQRPALSSSTPSPARRSPVKSPVKSIKSPLKKNVVFDLDSSTEDDEHSSAQQHGSFV
ncbi:hypothetical protein BG015_000462 [Linnemannia schmuckeri]|uniref:Transmembrane protein n=1 Tax=Linnemannia schmuckeri TaxID=64567 RepID=A0A9P5RR64_9FUNG|nr:hypothetical protein BG015_000462 [Linnemannia schmuckeri]